MKTHPSEWSYSHYALLAKTILVHDEMGYKFCWLLPSEDWIRRHQLGTESNGTVVGDHWEDMNQLVHQLGMNQRRKMKLSSRDWLDRIQSMM